MWGSRLDGIAKFPYMGFKLYVLTGNYIYPISKYKMLCSIESPSTSYCMVVLVRAQYPQSSGGTLKMTKTTIVNCT
jgi:hypothetical protein